MTPVQHGRAWLETLDGLADTTFRVRILWFSFRDLAEAAGKLITDPARVTSEQTRFLRAGLAAPCEADGQLPADGTVLAAARAAWPEYQRRAACSGSGDQARPPRPRSSSSRSRLASRPGLYSSRPCLEDGVAGTWLACRAAVGLATGLAGPGITASALAPGPLRTPLNAGTGNDPQVRRC
ncbi:MAG TPA: hypothetical protein VFQ68_33735 [Streptosporangiaceae bacterium]|nr:hypothetical protein [Streptosporangiaceae bacterium]